jgi:hypothetical protein
MCDTETGAGGTEDRAATDAADELGAGGIDDVAPFARGARGLRLLRACCFRSPLRRPMTLPASILTRGRCAKADPWIFVDRCDFGHRLVTPAGDSVARLDVP